VLINKEAIVKYSSTPARGQRALFALCVFLVLGYAGLRSAFADTPANCESFDIDAKDSHPLGQFSTPRAGSCKPRASSVDGILLPDPNCTPGAINQTLTADVLTNPDFRTGCVRDNATSAKDKANTYVWYKIPHPQNNRGVMQVCELDHLISLELGGADSLANIWPQCGPSKVVLRERYFKRKDAVENWLAKQVRDGVMKLEDAQNGIAQDWTQFLEEATKECSSGSGKCR
jgi:hypothetical protein